MPKQLRMRFAPTQCMSNEVDGTPPVFDVTAEQFARVVGGGWTRSYARRLANGRRLFVFCRTNDPADIHVLDSEHRIAMARTLSVPPVGTFYHSHYLDDPALAGLAQRLREHVDVRVLRYRPTKRITLSARDDSDRTLILKCVGRGAEGIVDKLEALRQVESELPFQVARPLWRDTNGNLFAQERLSGEPVRLDATPSGLALARALGNALDSLHRSSVVFDGCDTLATQQRRSARYVRMLERGDTDLADNARRLLERFRRLEQRLHERADRDRPLSPIHGSPHSRQWLRQGERLSLIDFDRASMGDPELDVATFLAEWDYEDPSLGEPIKEAFLSAFDQLDPCRLELYRAHKHLAKAYKAASSTRLNALEKARRNLNRAAGVTALAEACIA